MENAVFKIRERFPILNREVNGRQLVYLDNAATSQRPQCVMDMYLRAAIDSNANIHRAVYQLSSEATDLYESSREAVRKFINARSREEIVFTSGTTASMNLLAYSLAMSLFHKDDVILLSEAEHHSNIIPWYLISKICGARIKFIPVDPSGHIDMYAFSRLLREGRVRLVSVAHISNVLGIVNPISEIVNQAHETGAMVAVDGAQGVVHEMVDVQKLDCDFYAFSGHKIYAATGTGVLYGRRSLLEQMPPFLGGGEMVGTVSYQGADFAPLPLKFEAGTPNFNGTATFAPAIDIAIAMREEKIADNMKNMQSYLEAELRAIAGMHICGEGANKVPLFSFAVDGAHHEDIAILLDKMGVAVRSGQMCAEPIISKFGYTGLVRVSLAPYNTLTECEYFIESLRKVLRML